jgi:simple sugar transport system ATP-binding protein
VKINGARCIFRKPRDAIAMGIGMVHQEIELISQYTVWENVVLGAEPVVVREGHSTPGAPSNSTAGKIDEFQFNLDPSAQVGTHLVAAARRSKY